jgi:hypothetical protein
MITVGMAEFAYSKVVILYSFQVEASIAREAVAYSSIKACFAGGEAIRYFSC